MPVSYTHLEMFGKGSLEGIAAAESSNNAVVGSAMIPLLTLGIPGDGVTALLLGAFILHGIQPGPVSYTHLDVYKRQPQSPAWEGIRPPT